MTKEKKCPNCNGRIELDDSLFEDINSCIERGHMLWITCARGAGTDTKRAALITCYTCKQGLALCGNFDIEKVNLSDTL